LIFSPISLNLLFAPQISLKIVNIPPRFAFTLFSKSLTMQNSILRVTSKNSNKILLVIDPQKNNSSDETFIIHQKIAISFFLSKTDCKKENQNYFL